jgi:hypothetical protein
MYFADYLHILKSSLCLFFLLSNPSPPLLHHSHHTSVNPKKSETRNLNSNEKKDILMMAWPITLDTILTITFGALSLAIEAVHFFKDHRNQAELLEGTYLLDHLLLCRDC